MPANDRFVASTRRLGQEIVRRIGRELRDARIALGLSQSAVAKLAALSRSKVGRIEHRQFLRERSASFTELFPVAPRDLLMALAAGRRPRGNAVVLV